jgi:DNA-binding beta-propeller fold protein YncE
MRRFVIWGAFLAMSIVAAGGCNNGGVENSSAPAITLNITSTTVSVGGSVQFLASVVNTANDNQLVTWQVNGITGGNATIGTIDSTGLYIAPPAVPNPDAVTITAVSQVSTSTTATATVTITSGISVSVTPATASLGTGETFQFSATVTGTTNQGVTWQVNSITGGDSTLGTISTSGIYVAPTTAPSDVTITITAISQADTTQSASSTVTLETASDPTVTSITPTHAGEGSLFVDAYITGTNFLSTTVALVNGTPVTTTYLSTDEIRANVPATLMSASAGTLTFQAERQGGNPISCTTVSLCQLTIDPVRPAVVADFPNSNSVAAPPGSLTAVSPHNLSTGMNYQVGDVLTIAGGGGSGGTVTVNAVNGNKAVIGVTITTVGSGYSTTSGAASSGGSGTGAQFDIIASTAGAVEFTVDGGYFGTSAGSPTVSATYDGHPEATLNVNPRQMDVTIPTADLAQAGLHPVAITNPGMTTPAGAPQDEAVTNFAVQTVPANASIIAASLSQPGTSNPVAVAVNTATGIAVVVNQGSNNLTLIDLTQGAPVVVPGGPIPVGNGASSVAIDSFRNLAIVTNTTDNTLSVVNLATHGVTTVSANVLAAPYAVGVNPQTGIGIVAYQSSSIGTFLDLTQTPPAIVGAVTMPTGKNPHIAVEPRLNWGLVTPGGAGVLSIIDFSRNNSPVSIAASGAVRVSATETVTITTTTPITILIGDAVLITGVADNSFNGVQTVTSVPNSTSFTFTQSGPDATSGGGQIQFSEPLATVAFGLSVSGVSINRETKTALLTDSTSSDALLMSLLDQTVSDVPIEIGAVASGINQYTNIGLTLNPALDQLSIIDPTTPTRLSTIALPGSNPSAVAVDPGTDLALVTNSGTNDVTVISLGAIKPLELDQVVIPASNQISPDVMGTSTSDVQLTLIGKGFVSGSVGRLDGVTLTTIGPVTDRQMTVDVPASLLSAPRRFAVDVENPGNVISNAEGLTVVQFVDLATTSCPLPVPAAVAIDDDLNQAVVAESSCATASVIDLNTGNLISTVNVGADPQGVAVDPGSGIVAVTNRGADTASVFNLTTLSTAPSTVTVAGEPIGVAINPNDQTVVVANFNSNSDSISTFSGLNPTATTPTTVDSGGTNPYAVAIDPYDSLLLVANAGSSTLTISNIQNPTSPGVGFTASGPNQPTGAVFDPVTHQFIVASSLSNSVFFVNNTTQQVTSARVGINPAALALNYLTSTLVTANTASSTISVMDILTQKVSVNLGIPGSSPTSVAIQKERNLAVVTDQANNRLILIPLPK